MTSATSKNIIMGVRKKHDETLRMVKGYKTADKGYTIPANWSNNEITGDYVIVPPAWWTR